MTWRDLLTLIRKNLWRMKLRVMMTAVGVLIGTTAIILLVSLGAGLQDIALQDLGDIGDLTLITVYSASEFGGLGAIGQGVQKNAVLNDEAVAQFKELPGVTIATPLIPLMVQAQLSYREMVNPFVNVVGIDAHDATRLGMETQSGEMVIRRGQVVMGQEVLNNFFDRRRGDSPGQPPDLLHKNIELVAQKINQDGTISERRIRLRLSGILKASGGENDFTVYMDRKEVENINRWASGTAPDYRRMGYSRVIVKVSDPKYALPVQGEITRQGFMAYSAQSILEGLNQFFLVIKVVLGGVGSIALLVAGFGIANAMVMAIYERTREIGLMKAIGARNRDVLFIFLGEASAIGALGGTGGVVFSWGIGALINTIGGSYIAAQTAQSGITDFNIPNLVHISPSLAIFAVIFAAGIGLLAGIYPALRATRLDPIQALRYE